MEQRQEKGSIELKDATYTYILSMACQKINGSLLNRP